MENSTRWTAELKYVNTSALFAHVGLQPVRHGGRVGLRTPDGTEAEKKDEVLDPSLNEVRLVVVKQRPVDYEVCPHCNQEIYHTYIDGDFASGNYVERHSECKA